MSDRYRDEEDVDLDIDDGEPPRRRRGRLLAVLIALFAIGGFGGVLWYAYSQGQRSADAVAPILRADGEPSRMRPEQPGGMVVPHQDKLVLNNMQQAGRTAQAERLLPPAEAPLPQTTRTAPPPSAAVTLPPSQAAAPPAVPPSSPATTSAPATTPAPAPTPAPPPVPPPVPPVSAAPAAPVTPAPPPLPPSGLVAPPAPPPVPPAPSGSAAPAPTPPPTVPTIPPPQTASRPPAATPTGRGGEWRIQLGSFPQADQASAQGDRLKRAVAELQGLDLTTVRVDLGAKGVWYRLQAGPLAEAAARQMCEDLKSKKRDCLVVRP